MLWCALKKMKKGGKREKERERERGGGMGDCLCKLVCSLCDAFYPAVGKGMAAWKQLFPCYRRNKRNVGH